MPAPIRLLYMRYRLFAMLVTILISGFSPVLPTLATLVALATVGALCGLARGRAGAVVSGAVLGVACSAWQGHGLLASGLPLSCVREPVEVAGVVNSLPRTISYGFGAPRQRFEFMVESLAPDSCSGPKRVILSYYGDQVIEAGQGWKFKVRLRHPRGLANPGSYNIRSWYAESGIHAVGSVVTSSGERQVQLDAGLAAAHQRLRQKLSSEIAGTGLSLEGEAVLRAVSVADKSGIDHQLWSWFHQYGVNHLLVISGLHVGMVAAVGLLLGRGVSAVLRRWATLAAYLPPLCATGFAAVYAAMAGFSVATQRALIMLVCLMLGHITGRGTSPAAGLGLAAVLITAINPLAIVGSGFWLSFSAVVALLWLATWRPAGGVFWAHGYMSVLMLPLGGLWFGGASLVSAPANLVLVPLFGFWLVPLALLGAASVLLIGEFAQPLWRAAAWPLEQVLSVIRLADSGGFLLPLKPGVVASILVGLGVMLLVVPGIRWHRGMSLLLILPLLLAPVRQPASLRLAVLDVGQGTSIVVLAGSKALVYDTGGGNPAGANLAQSVLLPFLRSLGVTELETLVISHGDLDHAAGVATLRREMPIRHIWQGGRDSLLESARPCRAGRTWRWPVGWWFRFLSPAGNEGSANDASCVLLLEVGGSKILIAGDIERAQERELLRYWRNQLDVDVLVVAHHGSGTSTTQAWLNQVQPHTAIISHGYANRFGHPDPLVLRRLRQQGVKVFSTAQSGALELEINTGGKLVVAGWRARIKPWWM